MSPNRPGASRDTAATLGISAAEDIEAFRSLFMERSALEAHGGDPAREDAIRRELVRLAPAVQRHLEALGGALVGIDDPSATSRAQRQPLPLTYVAAFGAPEDYQPHAEALAGALDTAAGRFRSGEGGEERLRRRRRHHTSHCQRLLQRTALWLTLSVAVAGFYVAGLRALGDWGTAEPGKAPSAIDHAMPGGPVR